ncbi:MAG TPA: GPP34 family phosphoprotein [Micromonosporaceae bacterium]|nr:GPP34 family phosphoprotein [Micromonosporaceae bacterium]
MTHLALAEELLLLAYDDETGRSNTSRIALDLGLTAAVLVELALRGRLAVVDGGVAVRDPEPTGDRVADGVLARVAADATLPAASWVQRLRHGLREAVLDALVERGVVGVRDESALDVIVLRRYPAADPGPEAETRARLAAALTGGTAPEERTAALAALVAAVRMEPALGLSGAQLDAAHQRLEEIASGAGFAGETLLEQSTVRPSVAYVLAELARAIDAALGTRPSSSR